MNALVNTLWTWFWAAMVFGSIAWYFLLLFYVGYKGGREIVRMIRALASPRDAPPEPAGAGPGGG